MHGSWRAGKREGEPMPDPARPPCPTWLSRDAKHVWRRLVPQLEAMGTPGRPLFGKCDGNAVARYCQTFAKWKAAEKMLQAKPDDLVRETPVGLKLHPMALYALRLSETLLRLERQFGLTPSARAGLAVTKASNPLENRGKSLQRHFKDADAG
jgi:P27 family predicted phage terminase small subunit